MEGTLSENAISVPISAYFPLPVGIDPARVDATDDILEQGDVAVCKSTRAGFTTSGIIAAHKRGKKTLIVSPTKRIASSTVKNTVNRIGGIYCNIPGNQSCKYVKEIIEEDRFFKEIPIPTGDCKKCEEYNTCPVTEFERIDNFTVVTMTYAKLEAIMVSEISETFCNKLADIDLVIFDEAHVISFPSLPQVDLDESVTIPDESECYALGKAYKEFCLLRNEHWGHADDIKKFIKSQPDQYTGFRVEIPNAPSPQLFRFQWEQLLKIALSRKSFWLKEEADDQVLALKNIVSIMGGVTATISCIKSGDVEKMIITSGQGNIQRAIQNLLCGFVPKAKVCFVSGTLIECRPGFFAEIAEREITNVIFPDICNTNAKMHIHPSKWKFSALNSENGIERAIKEIREINEEVGQQPIYLIAMNKRDREQLKTELKDCANIKVDFYRSKNTIGVERSERICIVVGLAHTPRHSCDPLAQGADDHERYLDSQQLRMNEVHAATWQALSRVKDPNGKVESHVYCVGVRAEEISDVVTWGTNRTIKASSDAEGKRIWRVEVDEELARPIVHAEDRTSRGLNRHGIREYIDRVQGVKSLIEYRKNSEESILFPYYNNNNRGNVDILRNSDLMFLHNDPSCPDDLEATSFALTMLFAGRLDCYACQSKNPGKDGEYGFRKKETTTDIPSLIMKHLNGSETIGFYPFDTQDMCYYCVIDIQERDNAMKLSQFLLDNNLPVLVERLVYSDSYHIWIPIIPAKTHTVYKFVKQLLHDAGINGAVAYPRQKSIDTCYRSCGSSLMLPLGINSEKNRISEFIDPKIFVPIAIMPVDKVVRLRDMQESKLPPEEKEDQNVCCGS